MKIAGSSRKDGMSLYGPQFRVDMEYKDGICKIRLRKRVNNEALSQAGKIPGLRGPLRLLENSWPLLLAFGLDGAAQLCAKDEKKLLFVEGAEAAVTAVLLWKIVGNGKALRRFHGAEHKVIGAAERDGQDTMPALEELRKVSRVSPRCGTNYAGFYVTAQLLVQLLPEKWMRSQFLRNLIALSASYEAFRLDPKKHAWVRPFHKVGAKLQYYVTTAEPEDEELLAAAEAMRILLLAEQGKISVEEQGKISVEA